MDIKKAQSGKTLLKDWWDDVVEYNFDTLNNGLEDEKKRSQDKDSELTQSLANEQEERKAADTSLQQKISDKIGFDETTVSADGSKYINWDNETKPKIYSVTADADIPVGNDTGIMIIFKSGGFVEDVGMVTVHLESDISQLYITGKDIYYRKQSNTTAEWTQWSKMTDLIGVLENLNTNDKTSIVAAINETWDGFGSQTGLLDQKIEQTSRGIYNDIGEMSYLKVPDTYNLVDAVNYIYDNCSEEADLSGYATKEELGSKADKSSSGGGFIAGDGASEVQGNINIVIGKNAYGADYDIAIGENARASDNCIAIGNNSDANGHSISLGIDAKSEANAIQIGNGTNVEPNTVQIKSYQLLDGSGNIPSERIPQLNEKSDKTAIVKSEETAPTLNMAYNTEVRYGEVSSLTLTLPQSFEDDYISSVVFTSGNAAVNLIYPEEIKISGEDCMDGIFTPVENKRYTLILSYDGVYVSGIVGGVTI